MWAHTMMVGNTRARRYTPFAFGQDLLFGGPLWNDALQELRTGLRDDRTPTLSVAGPP